jgi:hypothetical protein
MTLQKKIQPKLFSDRNPTENDNISTGFSLGQIWRNVLTNDEYIHFSDGIWYLANLKTNNTFTGVYVLTLADYNLITPDANILYILKQ